MRWIRWLLQYGIGLILLFAGVGKLLDNRYAAHLLAQWKVIPEGNLLLVLTMIFSLSELVLALWLFSGKHLAKAALVAIAFHAAYTVGTVFTLLRGIQLPDCGCFGILYPHALDWVMAAEDFVFTILSFALFLLARRRKGEAYISH